VINKPLAKNPDDRYKSAGEMVSALKDVQTQITTRQKSVIPAIEATLVEGPEPEPVDATLVEQPAAPQVPAPVPPVSGPARPDSIAVESPPGLPPTPAKPVSRPTGERKVGMRPALLGGGLAGIVILACRRGIFVYNAPSKPEQLPAALASATSQGLPAAGVTSRHFRLLRIPPLSHLPRPQPLYRQPPRQQRGIHPNRPTDHSQGSTELRSMTRTITS
jgi:hypothetical protein